MDLVPPKLKHETQENYMKNLVDLLVETTQQSTTYEQLERETTNLFHRIVDGCRQPMLVAAKNKHATAQIFVYLIGEEGSGRSNSYDLLFPSGNIAELMLKFGIKPVFQQVKEHLAPLEVNHKIYEVYRSNAIEITDHTSDFIFDILAKTDDGCSDSDAGDSSPYENTLDEPVVEDRGVEGRVEEYIEGVKKLDPVRRYVGVITVSWAHAIAAGRSARATTTNV